MAVWDVIHARLHDAVFMGFGGLCSECVMSV